MGYLRKEQKRYAEALAHFRAAVGIDPLYLSAWKQIYDLAGKIHVEAWEVNTAALNIRKLDPLSRHSNISYERVSDLPGLWRVTQSIHLQFADTPTEFYPLEASAVFAEQLANSGDDTAKALRYMDGANRNRDLAPHPALEIAKTPFVQTALQSMFGRQAVVY